MRNLKGRIIWGNNLNILHGNNAQGKTNWLEAICLLAHTKSFRTASLHEVLKFGETQASIVGTLQLGNEITRHLQIEINRGAKKTLVNGKRETLASYSAQLHAVWFTADELEVVRGGPEARRSFLDRGVVSLHPPYAQTLSDYNHVIKQKKRLLKQTSEGQLRAEELFEMISPWNQQLIQLSTLVHRARTEYVHLLNDALEHTLFGDAISIRYVSSLEGKGDLSNYEGLIADRLRLRMEAEMFAGACLIGPHRDDLEILFRDRNLRSFGSSGQQRSALITLDLAAISVYHSKHHDYPIFLIDDVDAELDGSRIERLLEHLDGRTQTFVTTSKRNHFQPFNTRANFYEIYQGAATPETVLTAKMRVGRVI